MEKQLYTLSETEKIIKVAHRTLLRWVKEGKIEAHKVGGQWRIKEDTLKAFTDADEQEREQAIILKAQADAIKEMKKALKDNIKTTKVLELFKQHSNELTHQADADNNIYAYNKELKAVEILKDFIVNRVMYDNSYFKTDKTGFMLWDKE